MARTKRAGRPKASKARAEDLPSDLVDEVDKFHQSKDKLHLDTALDDAAEESFSDDNDAGVYDLDLDSGDEESEEETTGDVRLTELARQERFTRAKLQLQQGEETGSESEDGKEDQRGHWGSRKKAYYEDREVSEEEELREEEEEARALQQAAAQYLRQEDFGANTSDEEEDSAENSARAGHQVVEIRRSMAPDSKQELVQGEAPELQVLLLNLKSSLEEVRSRIAPLVNEVREEGLATTEGVSYLETKNLLLLHYCLHLVFYLLLKAEGNSVRQHPVMTRLVEIRAFLEKIRPIDKKLRYQMEKLLTSHQLVQANGAAEAEADIDPLQYRPNPDALVSKVAAAKDSDQTAQDGLYRPPRLNPVAMEDDPDKEYHRREKRAAADKARRLAQSDLVKDLTRELADAPEELRDTLIGEDTDYAAQQRARLDRRAAEEEELMTRVPLRKKELANLKAAHRVGMSGGALLDDFADDISKLFQATADAGGSVSQRFGADLNQTQIQQSGDAELPTKMSLADRRAQMDSARAKQVSAKSDEAGNPKELHAKRERAILEVDDDNAYDEAERVMHRKKAAKLAKYSAPALQPPLEDEQINGARKVTKAVEKNRGLTPHRRKDTKNPRVKGRKKFEKATIRRKGQVVEVKKPTGAYGGEQTGIKSGVAKSTRFYSLQ